MIGDRPTDVETGLNAKGIGVFIQSDVDHSDISKIFELQTKHPSKVFIAKDFYNATQIVEKKISDFLK